jgi:Tc5 transposase DNA-binding domain.
VEVSRAFSSDTLKQPNLVQFDRVLYKWFTTACSEGKPVTGPMIIKEVKFFNEGLKITDHCTFSEGWLQN